MSGEFEYILTDEQENIRHYATSALQGIVIAAIITGNKKFEDPKNIAGAAFEIAEAMKEQEEKHAPKKRPQ